MGKKILIVDDEELTVKLLEKRLFSQDYNVVSAKTGQEALRKIASEKPDFILMDIMLPDIDGPEVVRSLHANPYTKDTPVLFLSSVIDRAPDGAVSKVKVGEIRYDAIGKPVDIDVLLKKIRIALAKDEA